MKVYHTYFMVYLDCKVYASFSLFAFSYHTHKHKGTLKKEKIAKYDEKIVEQQRIIKKTTTITVEHDLIWKGHEKDKKMYWSSFFVEYYCKTAQCSFFVNKIAVSLLIITWTGLCICIHVSFKIYKTKFY